MTEPKARITADVDPGDRLPRPRTTYVGTNRVESAVQVGPVRFAFRGAPMDLAAVLLTWIESVTETHARCCPRCNGSAWVHEHANDEGDECPVCHGAGVLPSGDDLVAEAGTF